MRFLILGSGAREHAILKSLLKSDTVSFIAVISKNTALEKAASISFSCSINDIEEIIVNAKMHAITHVIIGPEQPLVNGYADKLRKNGFSVIGPDKNAAMLEGSKIFMKAIAKKYMIPSPSYAEFANLKKAKQYINNQHYPIVIKADGLAGGKGVKIAYCHEEAVSFLDSIMDKKIFGKSGSKIIIEDFVSGTELSYFVLCDGRTMIPFAMARDYKRLSEDLSSPNTGGMGCISYENMIDDKVEKLIWSSIVNPLSSALKNENISYKGILFLGLMIKDDIPQLLEINCRFGDPECQTLLLRLKSDFAVLMDKVASGTLDKNLELNWHKGIALTIVVAQQGYPFISKYKPEAIPNLEQLESNCGSNESFWHGNIEIDSSGKFSSKGGRVLTIGAILSSLDSARSHIYSLITKLAWTPGVYRNDIGC